MGILTIVFSSRGAAVPYLELMEQLSDQGVDCLTYVTGDVRSYAANFDTPTLIDRFNLAQFSAGDPGYESAKSTLAVISAGRRILGGFAASAMRTIAAAADSGQFIPAETVVITTTNGLLLLGHFLLELGVKSFVCMEAYRWVDWADDWKQDGSQWAPAALPRSLVAPLFRLPFASVGKQKAQEHFGRPISHDFGSIKAAVKKQLYMYSPQLTEDKHLAFGYPYPPVERPMQSDLADFIAIQRQHGKRIIALTVGSMEINQQKKDSLIDEFVTGIRGLGDATGIVLGYGPIDDDSIFSTLEFVPYTALFPEIDLVVTHGGSGTTHLALFTGTPVLNIPFIPDQFDWANRLERLGMQVGMISQKEFTAEWFIENVQQNLTEAVVTAAREAGEIERSQHNSIQMLMDQLIAVVETARVSNSDVAKVKGAP